MSLYTKLRALLMLAGAFAVVTAVARPSLVQAHDSCSCYESWSANGIYASAPCVGGGGDIHLLDGYYPSPYYSCDMTGINNAKNANLSQASSCASDAELVCDDREQYKSPYDDCSQNGSVCAWDLQCVSDWGLCGQGEDFECWCDWEVPFPI